MALQRVSVSPISVERLKQVVSAERWSRLEQTAARARELLDGRVVWNVNSTASGGGVAEMLDVLVAYALGAGLDMRWVVIAGDAAFFAITKRLHNLLHGAPGDGGPLGDDERAHYDAVTSANANDLVRDVGRDDVVILHDPQTAGMASALRDACAAVIWRCHVGSDEPGPSVTRAWEFLRPSLEPAAVHVFSRRQFVPDWMDGDRVAIIPPSIDPFAAKNQELARDAVRAILARAGVLAGDSDAAAEFVRRDGQRAAVTLECDVVRTGGPIPATAPLVVQVSRWDRLKDMAGVLQGFADHVTNEEAFLALVGPAVTGVADDPEGEAVLTECKQAWEELPAKARDRIHLVSVPMDDVEENAAVINALQRHAMVVVQKSLAEGFGLTVAEAMWKARPVVASRIGGIQDQIVDGEHGVLLSDPHDLPAFGAALDRLLGDPREADRLGKNAKARVTEQFIGDRHLMQWADLLGTLLRPA